MTHDAIGYRFVLPQGAPTALHITNARDAIDDAHIVAVTGLQLGEQLRIIAPRRFTDKVLTIAYANGS